MTFPQMTTTPQMGQQALNEAIAQLVEDKRRGKDALKNGAPALERLIVACEQGVSGQRRKIAKFLGACWNGHRHFDLFELRAVDTVFSDDMLLVLDVLRWGEVALANIVSNGDARIVSILKSTGMYGEGQRGQAIALDQ